MGNSALTIWQQHSVQRYPKYKLGVPVQKLIHANKTSQPPLGYTVSYLQSSSNEFPLTRLGFFMAA